jgi:hypothetical protein
MQVHLLRVLCSLIRSAQQFNSMAVGPVEFRAPIDAHPFASLISILAMCFMVMQPFADLRGATHNTPHAEVDTV